MNIQYFHKRLLKHYIYEIGDINAYKTVLSARGGETFAVEVPKLDFFQLAKQNEDSTVVIAYGRAACSLDDNYCKAIGREFSRSRIQDTSFEFRWVELSDGSEKYFLIGDKIALTFKKHGNRVYFVEAT
jgi:hypothetical protein